jgi:hypothetical protein
LFEIATLAIHLLGTHVRHSFLRFASEARPQRKE